MTGMQDFYSAKDIARIMGWTTHRAKRWLKRTGAGFKLGHGTGVRWYTTVDRLRSEFPELLDMLVRKKAEVDMSRAESTQVDRSRQRAVS